MGRKPKERAVRLRLRPSTSAISSKHTNPTTATALPYFRVLPAFSSSSLPTSPTPQRSSRVPSSRRRLRRANAPSHPRSGGRRRASAVVALTSPRAPRAWLGRDPVALQRPRGAQLRRGHRGRRARRARRGDPPQAAMPRRRRRPLRLRPREGLRSRCAASRALPLVTLGPTMCLAFRLIWAIFLVAHLRCRCPCAFGECVRATSVGRADSQVEAGRCTRFCPLNCYGLLTFFKFVSWI
jgi:hypothetical protein